jgi:GNAT superfamily N-acetyltransferase
MSDAAWRVRVSEPGDSFEELTELLHRAYAPLAERGLRYLATHQDADTTRQRAAKGTCFVAVASDGTLIGTIVVYPPTAELDHGNLSGASGPEWYQRPGVASFGQYGVEPAWKGRGIGRALHIAAESHARSLGAIELACDTAEPATDLVEMYARWGYRQVATTQWEVTNYRSVVLSKTLVAEASA